MYSKYSHLHVQKNLQIMTMSKDICRHAAFLMLFNFENFTHIEFAVALPSQNLASVRTLLADIS